MESYHEMNNVLQSDILSVSASEVITPKLKQNYFP